MVKTIQKLLYVLLVVTISSSAQPNSSPTVQLNTLIDDDINTQGTLLIENAKIHTMGTQGMLKNGSLLIENGKISMIGTGIPKPEGVTIINARGKDITPGLMNAQTSLGLVEISAIDSTIDSKANNKDYSASFSIAGAINPNSSLIPHNRINGLTRAMVIPANSKSLFQGKGSLIKLSQGMQTVVLEDNAAYLTYGEKGARNAGGSRALALMQIREVLREVKDFRDDDSEFKSETPLKKRDIKALLPVLKGDIPLVITVHRASDIMAMIKLNEEFSLKMIFSGVEEGWMIADKIAAAKIPVIIDPYLNLPNSFEKIASRIDNATLLHKAGVELIIANLNFTGSHNAYVIRQSAGNAVTHGLPWDIALAAITSMPGKWFGVANQYGTLEAGMDADLVIWDGDPLEVTTSAERVFIQGKEIPMISRQTRLRDRYLNKTDLPAAYSR